MDCDSVCFAVSKYVGQRRSFGKGRVQDDHDDDLRFALFKLPRDF